MKRTGSQSRLDFTRNSNNKDHRIPETNTRSGRGLYEIQ